MKKSNIILKVVCLVLIIGSISLFMTLYKPDYPWTQEYVIGNDNIKGEVNKKSIERISKDFLIGANKYGYAVFKNPYKAFMRLKKEYPRGIKLIKKEFKLGSLNQFNYDAYGRYGCQVTTGTEEEQREAMFVSSFMDIYENSFKQ